MNPVVSWIFDVQLKPGQAAAWSSLMTEMVTATRATEPGTLGYEWSSTADGQQWQIHETYADADAAVIHCNTFARLYAARFFDCVTPARMVVSGAPNDAVRKALGPTAIYMQHQGGFTR